MTSPKDPARLVLLPKPWRRLEPLRPDCLLSFQLGKKRGTTISVLDSPLETSDQLLRRRALSLALPGPEVVRSLATEVGISVTEWLEDEELNHAQIPLDRWEELDNSFAQVGGVMWGWNERMFLECHLRTTSLREEALRGARLLLGS